MMRDEIRNVFSVIGVLYPSSVKGIAERSAGCILVDWMYVNFMIEEGTQGMKPKATPTAGQRRAFVPVVSALFVAASLTGCVTRGENFSSHTGWIKVDTTSQVDVSVKLGRPYIVGSSSGVPTWTYGYYKHSLFGSSMIKELKFYFDKDKKVSRYTFSSSFPADRSLN